MLAKFDAYQSSEKRERFMRFIKNASERVLVETVATESRDPDDNMFLALALDGRANVLITGDKKHLLPLNPYKGIQIVTPRAYADKTGLIS